MLSYAKARHNIVRYEKEIFKLSSSYCCFILRSYSFTGQYLDDTGLLFYNARYYDPGIGRFVSADSIVPGAGSLTVTPSDAVATAAWAKTKEGGAKNPQELNRYSSVLNNPMKWTDPGGHCYISCKLQKQTLIGGKGKVCRLQRRLLLFDCGKAAAEQEKLGFGA